MEKEFEDPGDIRYPCEEIDTDPPSYFEEKPCKSSHSQSHRAQRVRRGAGDETLYLSGWAVGRGGQRTRMTSSSYPIRRRSLPEAEGNEVRIDQPAWYAGRRSEGEALDDIWGADYRRRKRDWCPPEEGPASQRALIVV